MVALPGSSHTEDQADPSHWRSTAHLWAHAHEHQLCGAHPVARGRGQ